MENNRPAAMNMTTPANPKVVEARSNILKARSNILKYQKCLEDAKQCLEKLQRSCLHERTKNVHGCWSGEPTGDIECLDCGLIFKPKKRKK